MDDAAYIPLPRNLADPAAQAAAVFDRIAPLYDRARPGYPPAAVADLRRICGISQHSQVLEIGCGTGQLTRDLAATGPRIRCVEAGPELAELARGNLSQFSNVDVVTSTFENYSSPPGSYDVVVSATAFHWIDPALSYAKAVRLLRTNGCLALLTNTHSAGGNHTEESFADAVRELQSRIAPELGDWTFPNADEIEINARRGGDIAAVWARVDRKLWDTPSVSELFEAPTVKAYRWVVDYHPDAYVAMLASQSSYALLEQNCRQEILAGIENLIRERLGEVVTKEYVTVLAVAKRS